MSYLAPSLVGLRNRINSLYPRRDKGSDGWIGDAAHASRTSDHNPDWKGCVHAIDVDKDGINVARLLAGVIGHSAVQYVIHDGKIWSRSWGWTARKYNGINPHHAHVHVSIVHTSAGEDWSGTWLPNPRPKPKPSRDEVRRGWLVRLLKKGNKGADVKRVQKAVGATVDGDFGPKTEKAVQSFQRKHHLTADGIVGPKTVKALGWAWKGK